MFLTQASAASDPGSQWAVNQDAYRVDETLQVFIVCDGVGGLAAGGVASQLTCETVLRRLYDEDDVFHAVRDGSKDPSAIARVVAVAIRETCADVWKTAEADETHHGMGSTVTLLAVVGDKAIIGHVGHSRVYLARRGTVHQLTTDHTITSELLAGGMISPREASSHPMSRVLTRAVGIQPSVRVDTLVVDLLPGDRFLLCTDGLSRTVPDANWLAEQLEADHGEVAERLIAHANAAGGRDNITALVVDVRAPEGGAFDARAHDLALNLDSLRAVFLFEALPLAQLTRVLNACDNVICEAGQTIGGEDSPIARLIVVADGRFELRDEAGRTLRTLSPGDHVGDTSLLAQQTAPMTLHCVDGGRLLALPREAFRTLCLRRPLLGVALLGRLGEHLSDALQQTRRRKRATP